MTCLYFTPETVTGIITGYCGRAIGSGTIGGHPMNFTVVGSLVVMTTVAGAFAFAMVMEEGQSCLLGATRWTLVGGGALAL